MRIIPICFGSVLGTLEVVRVYDIFGLALVECLLRGLVVVAMSESEHHLPVEMHLAIARDRPLLRILQVLKEAALTFPQHRDPRSPTSWLIKAQMSV